MRPTNRGTSARAAIAMFAAMCASSCGGAEVRGRPARLASRDVNVDRTLVRARERAEDGDLAAAEQLLRQMLEAVPGDPLAQVARVERARLLIAGDRIDEAEELLRGVGDAIDPALAMRKALVMGIVYARRGEVEAGTRALRPLARRMIDRAECVAADCGLAALEARGGRPAEALRALARVESQAEGGVRWIPTGLACDAAPTRAAEVTRLLAGVDDPRALADTLDALPPDHPIRVEVARRLRALAEARNEIPQWLHWLADLPDTEATLRVVEDAQGPESLRVAILAPTSGPRAVLGAELLRAVQVALEDQRAVEIEVEDEPEAPSPRDSAARRAELTADLDAAVAHLLRRRPHAIIGPALEDQSAAVAARATSAGVDVYLLSPHVDDTSPLGARVVAAGPPPSMRAAALAAAVRARGTHARWTVAPGSERGIFATRVRASLSIAGVTPVEGAALASRDLHLTLGPWGFEARSQIATSALAAPTRWVFDARSGPQGSPGVWVGVAPSERAEDRIALQVFRERTCELTGRPPSELALLAFDAARAMATRVRGAPVITALARPWRVLAAPTSDGVGALAVTWNCPPR